MQTIIPACLDRAVLVLPALASVPGWNQGLPETIRAPWQCGKPREAPVDTRQPAHLLPRPPVPRPSEEVTASHLQSCPISVMGSGSQEAALKWRLLGVPVRGSKEEAGLGRGYSRVAM